MITVTDDEVTAIVDKWTKPAEKSIYGNDGYEKERRVMEMERDIWADALDEWKRGY